MEYEGVIGLQRYDEEFGKSQASICCAREIPRSTKFWRDSHKCQGPHIKRRGAAQERRLDRILIGDL